MPTVRRGASAAALRRTFERCQREVKPRTIASRRGGGVLAAFDPVPQVRFDGRLVVGNVTVDPARRSVHIDGSDVTLTATEFDLLAYLMRRPGRVFTREQLLSEVWGYAVAAGTRTVDVHVAQLRAKLGPASPIRTVRGVGYAAGR